MLYLCYDRGIVHKIDSLQIITNMSTYVGTIMEDGGTIETSLVWHLFT